MSTITRLEPHDDRSRIAWIDYAKGIGIVLVVYGHVISGLSNAGVLQTISVEAKYGLDLTVQAIYTFHMPLFFFLSGLLFKDRSVKTDRQRVVFAGKKTAVLMYPYVIWSIIYSIVMVLSADKMNRNGMSWGDIPYQLVIDPKSHLWFLYALCLSSLLVLVLKKYLSIWAIVGLSMLFQLGAGSVSGLLSSVMSLTIFFVLGHCFSKDFLESKRQFKAYQYGLLGLFGIVIHMMSFMALVPDLAAAQPISPMFGFILSIVGILAVTSLSYGLATANQWGWLKTLGSFALHIYILHMLTWVAVRILLLKVFKTDQFAIHFTLGMLAGLVPPIVLGRLAQRYQPWLFSPAALMQSLKQSPALEFLRS